jgi:regulator of sirC expression with transglutaminase-like and TPR domain
MADLDVLEGAIRIARVEYPDLDGAALRARLDEMAEEARPRVEGRPGRDGARRLLEVFTGPLGFHGNHEDYGDPRNSYLNDVVERRTGIPISLCWVYVELARRVGLRAHGVGFPGHFLAKAGQGNNAIILDCFNGRELAPEACAQLLSSAAPGVPSERLHLYLASATPRAVLFRMLANLRRIHEERGDYERVLRWLELQSDFGDPSPELIRDRGLVEMALGRPSPALAYLERYVRTAPEAADVDVVRHRISLCRRMLAELN